MLAGRLLYPETEKEMQKIANELCSAVLVYMRHVKEIHGVNCIACSVSFAKMDELSKEGHGALNAQVVARLVHACTHTRTHVRAHARMCARTRARAHARMCACTLCVQYPYLHIYVLP